MGNWTRSKRMLLIAAGGGLLLFLYVVYEQPGQMRTSTASMIIVTEKQHSSDYRTSWVMAYDPNSPNRQMFKIVVKDPIIWNLIEKDREYFASYFKKGNEDYHFHQLQYSKDNDALR
ncbi:hypothetical protein [Gorillibacterium sp. sgz500922]|uniref:hypothetical protein n=1 Tax=Gorillibacterium sp. sgz500922 TaxID=3446694 RepID=UPI003F6773C2